MLYYQVQAAEKQKGNQYDHRPANQSFPSLGGRTLILLDPIYEAIEHGNLLIMPE
jgi:hypothetical protein